MTHTSILRWDVASGKELPSIGKFAKAVDNDFALSPDGRSIAHITEGPLYLLETATGQARLIVKDTGFATAVAFSPDGNLLALVNAGYRITVDVKKSMIQGQENMEQVRLVGVADGKVIHRFTGHIGGINCVQFSPDGRTLASGGQDTTVLLWDVTERMVPRMKQARPLAPEKLAELWTGMSDTAANAHECMCTLIAAADQAVPFLGAKIKPVAAVDVQRFARLLKKLDSDQFSEREEATQELKKLGDAIEPAVRQALQNKPALETRRRLQTLLADLEGSERLRCLRAIEVLERIGDQPARALLRRLAHGAAGAWLSEEARSTLHRLECRASD